MSQTTNPKTPLGIFCDVQGTILTPDIDLALARALEIAITAGVPVTLISSGSSRQLSEALRSHLPPLLAASLPIQSKYAYEDTTLPYLIDDVGNGAAPPKAAYHVNPLKSALGYNRLTTAEHLAHMMQVYEDIRDFIPVELIAETMGAEGRLIRLAEEKAGPKVTPTAAMAPLTTQPKVLTSAPRQTTFKGWLRRVLS